MRRLLLLATAAAAAFFVPSSGALACGTYIGIGDGNTGTVYVVDDGGGVDWIYLEQNGETNLQRGGVGGVTGLSSADTCGTAENPDTIIY